MNANQLEFLRLLGVYTAGRFDVWALAGPAKASCRAHVMSALAMAKVPQSRAGVTVIWEALRCIVKPEGSCLAVLERDASARASEIVLSLKGA